MTKLAYPIRQAIAFTGSADPWAGGEHSRISTLCESLSISCYVVPDGNHSLETGSVRRDIQILANIIGKTDTFIRSGTGQ